MTITIKNFHAHVYFDLDSRDSAARVREKLGDRFEVQLGRWHEAKVGHHPKSMYQVLFAPEQFGEIVPWLMLNREGLDILIHPTTSDDVIDHTDHALWLGTKLPLNIDVLRTVTS